MPSLAEILEDKKGFPDDRKITLADGVETTLGDLRDQGYFRKQDYTRKTEALARDRDAFAQEKSQFEQAKAGAEAELARLAEQVVQRTQNVAAGAPAASIDEVEAYMARDPVSQRLLAKQQALMTELETLKAGQQQAAEALKQQQQWFYTDLHQRALATLKPRMDEYGVKADDVIAFAKQHSIPRLDLAFNELTRDQQLEAATKKAAEDAHKKAYAQAKQELAAPAQLPQRRLAPALAPDAPKSLGDAWEAASRDPEILATMEGLPGS